MKEFNDVFGKSVDKTVEGVEKALKEQKGVTDPCVVLVKDEDMNVFLYFNLDAAIKHSLAEGSNLEAASTIPDARSTVQSRILGTAKDDLFNKVQATSYCYDALPLIVMCLIDRYCRAPILDMPIPRERREEYINKKMPEFENRIEETRSLQSLRDLTKEIVKEYDIILYSLVKYIEAIPKLKKLPPKWITDEISGQAPAPAPASAPAPAPNPEVEVLKKQLKEKNDELKKKDEEIEKLKEEIEKMKHEVKPPSPSPNPNPSPSPTPKRHSIFRGPNVIGKEMTFKPDRFIFNYGGKKEERVVFKSNPSTYMFFCILNAQVEELHLDKTKPVTCIIEKAEHRCSTDQPDEIPFTKEYHMPKGEDYYLCTIKDPKQ